MRRCRSTQGATSLTSSGTTKFRPRQAARTREARRRFTLPRGLAPTRTECQLSGLGDDLGDVADNRGLDDDLGRRFLNGDDVLGPHHRIQIEAREIARVPARGVVAEDLALFLDRQG